MQPMLAKLWHQYQALDWILILIMFLASVIMAKYVSPHCRTFLWNDPTISYPMHRNTFPNYSLVLMVIGSVLFYIVFVVYLVKPLQLLCGQSRSSYGIVISNDVCTRTQLDMATETLDSLRYDRNHANAAPAPRVQATSATNTTQRTGPLLIWIKGQLIASVMQFFVVSSVKLYAGRLRPDFIHRIAKCGINQSTFDMSKPNVYQNAICDASKTCSILRDGRLSFPSGHASTSFSVFTFISLFLFCHLRPFGNRGSFTRLLIALSPMSIAFICAVSRTRDNRHGFADILGGTVLGVTCAFVAFRLCIREVDDDTLNMYFARSVEGAKVRQLYGRLQFCTDSNDAECVIDNEARSGVNPMTVSTNSPHSNTRDTRLNERGNIRRSIDGSTDYGTPDSVQNNVAINMNCDSTFPLNTNENTGSSSSTISLNKLSGMRDRNLMQRQETIWVI